MYELELLDQLANPHRWHHFHLQAFRYDWINRLWVATYYTGHSDQEKGEQREIATDSLTELIPKLTALVDDCRACKAQRQRVCYYRIVQYLPRKGEPSERVQGKVPRLRATVPDRRRAS